MTPVTPTVSDTPTATTLPRTGVDTTVYLAMGMMLLGLGVLCFTVPEAVRLTER